MTILKTCAQDGTGAPIVCGAQATKRSRCPRHYQQWYRQQPKCRADRCNKIQAGHYYCRPHERLALSTRDSDAQAKTMRKFRSHITADPITGCWLWQDATNPNGYGMFGTGGTWLAHRFSYVWFFGGHAPGKVLDHLCNVTHCVRPDHLWPITNTNNISLMHQRALAGPQEFWRHARITPHSLSMILWAREVGLPWQKPAAFAEYGLAA